MIYSIVVGIALIIGRIKRTLFPGKRETGVLILLPAQIGSLGDEAILTGTVNFLESRGTKRFTLITYKRESYPELGTADIQYLDLGGFLRSRSLGWTLKAIRALAPFSKCYCLGTDVLDGYYSEADSWRRLELVKLAATLGISTSVIGFSFNDRNCVKCIQAFRSLPKRVRLCCRDNESAKRLAKAIDREVMWSGDPAFFLQPKPSGNSVDQVNKWTYEQRSKGRIVMGINLNYLHVKYFPDGRKEQMVERYSEILSKLKRQNESLCFAFISHDNRGDINDFSIAEEACKNCDASIRRDSLFVASTSSAPEIKAIAGCLDVVFTGRFHLAAACLGQSTPVSMIDYQGKVRGMCRLLHIERAVIPMNQLVSGDEIFGTLRFLVEQRVKLKRTIELEMPNLLERVVKNFEN